MLSLQYGTDVCFLKLLRCLSYITGLLLTGYKGIGVSCESHITLCIWRIYRTHATARHKYCHHFFAHLKGSITLATLVPLNCRQSCSLGCGWRDQLITTCVINIYIGAGTLLGYVGVHEACQSIMLLSLQLSYVFLCFAFLFAL